MYFYSDTLSVKSLPTQRKGKVISWNNPITVPLKTDQSPASAEQNQSSNANEGEVCKSPLPSDKVGNVDHFDTSNESEIDDPKSVRSDASLEFDEDHVARQPSEDVNKDSYIDATEEEYLKKAQEGINRIGSEITLNEPSSDNSSAKSVYPDIGDNPKTHEDDEISLTPSEKMNNKPADIINLIEQNTDDVDNDIHSHEGSETSSVLDKEDIDNHKVLLGVQSVKPKATKLITLSEKKMRAVYGRNLRKQLPAPIPKRDKERKPPGRAGAHGKGKQICANL